MRKIFQHGLFKSAFVLAVGTAGAQLLNILFSPIVTRVYGPDAFGLLGVFSSVVSVLAPFGAFSYPLAIVLPRKDSNAFRLVVSSILVALFFTFVMFLLLLIVEWIDSGVFSGFSLGKYFLLVPIAVLSHALMMVFSQWAIRSHFFRMRSKMAVAHSFLMNLSKVGVGSICSAATPLIVLTSLGNSLHALLLFLGIKHNQEHFYNLGGHGFSGGWSFKRCVVLLKKYKKFAVYKTPEASLSAIAQSLPVIMLGSLFGPSAAGYFTLAKLALSAPVLLVGNAVGDAIYPRIAKRVNNKGQALYLVGGATVALFTMGVIPFGIIFVWGESIFSFVFGNQWVGAGSYASWLSVWLLFMLANQPSLKVFSVLSAQKSLLMITICSVFFRSAALYGGYLILDNDISAVMLYSFSGVFVNLVLILYGLKLMWGFDRKSGAPSGAELES